MRKLQGFTLRIYAIVRQYIFVRHKNGFVLLQTIIYLFVYQHVMSYNIYYKKCHLLISYFNFLPDTNTFFWIFSAS